MTRPRLDGRLPDPRDRPWLTVAEVAEITGEGEKAIRAAIAAGQLPHLDIGRYVRVPTSSLCALAGITPDMQQRGLTPNMREGDASDASPVAILSPVTERGSNGNHSTTPPDAA